MKLCCQSVAMIYVEKIVSSWCRHSGPVTCLQDGHQETPATKATEVKTFHTAPRDMCALAIHKTFLTQEEIILAHTGMCCLLLLRNRRHLRSI